MSVDGWNSVLVLGGIRSGKSEFAESLLADAPAVRYVATGEPADVDDPDWAARLAAHRDRRPAGWTTEETGRDADRLVAVITEAKPDEALIVDDLGGWVTTLLERGDRRADTEPLVAAVRDCAARLVLVSPEVGLSVVPATPIGRAFADLLGAVNREVAAACDAVVLVVAGQPSWLKGAPTATSLPRPEPVRTPELPEVITPVASVAPPSPVAPASSVAPAASAAPAAPARPAVQIQPGMDLPMPDEEAGAAAKEVVAALDVSGAGLGVLERVVSFAAGTQGRATPEPWRRLRALLLRGDHDGGAAAGTVPGESGRRAADARAGAGAIAGLAAACGASLQVVDAPTSAPIEDGPALGAEEVGAALDLGWRLAEQAADEGIDLIVLAACGAGTDTACAAVLGAISGAEVPAVLGRVVGPGGRLDDNAWMTRCAAARDALHRIRNGPRGPRDVLAELAGGDVAIAVGALLGAASRRTPVLVDGPVGIAAALISRDLGGQARHWCLLPDHGRHPGVRLGADVLGLDPLVDLRMDLGEGATSLAALPLLNSALSLAAALPVHPSAPDTDAGA
ncbi:MAG TPA: bifunctional adenosylcobinamide kinase/adenosylcobinamide-phosphate guanylyltransferase [Micromonosporaceae bacterium]|nr:bifunctional adenosylcobinamide kinase/adenosylcobinamide-phosphate guanylyltransferase [Micromonosporaceae bacterium]